MIRSAAAIAPSPNSRVPSPVTVAQQLWASGERTELKQLQLTRGGADLLKQPKQLAKYSVGEFRAGRGPTLTVYRVLMPGPTDRLQSYRLVVKEPQVAATDRTTGKSKFYDLGVLASGPTV